jgi:hypothetical protein
MNTQPYFTDDDFGLLKRTFEGGNPALANNLGEIRKTIAEFDSDMQQLMADKPDYWQTAITILWQGRNFLALYAGEQPISLPFEQQEVESVTNQYPSALSAKHVAVYAASKVFAPAAKQALSLYTPLRFCMYTSSKELIEAILAGEVCGVVALQVGQLEASSIEATIRHDLKNLPGWDYGKAKTLLLPYCVNLSVNSSSVLVEAWQIIVMMQEGRYRPPAKSEEYSLDEELRTLLSHMQQPSRSILVTVIDDTPEEVAGIVAILNKWPNLNVQIVYHQHGMPSVTANTSILLLDENLADSLTGEQVVKHLRGNGFDGLIASTSGGGKPAHAQWHFGRKAEVTKDSSAALQFVCFINALLQKTQ